MTTIRIENLAPQQSEQQLTDFFSFCGEIEFIDLSSMSDGVALITFSTQEAADSALILNDASLGNNKLKITMVSSTKIDASDTPVEVDNTSAPVTETQAHQPATYETEGQVLSEEQLAKEEDSGLTSAQKGGAMAMVVALLASGYTLSDKAKDKAAEFDKKHNVSLNCAVKKETAKLKAHSLDERYKLTEKADVVKKNAQSVDEKIGISRAAKATKTTMEGVASQVLANQTVSRGVNFFLSGLSSIASAGRDINTAAKEVVRQEKERAQYQSQSPSE
eukprot:GCRY01000603.1.p1 GENE.GCRY01000603.1~~GCRY01000603.1.p1  ORF type:complete len:277 (+),score=45.39 GCRY01000603.1:181-1011(+)